MPSAPVPHLTFVLSATTVAIATLGCRLNQAEAESWVWSLAEAGYRVVGFGPGADAYVVHTCTVTHIADRKSRQRLLQANRYGPGRVVAAGCFAQRCPEETLRAGASLLVRAPEAVVAAVQGLLPNPEATGHKPAPASSLAQVKVQEGCSLGCTYCAIPHVRGRPRSRPMADVVSDVAHRTARGYCEVVLTGTLLGMYGKDLSTPSSLEGLVRALLTSTPAPRLRLSSLQPWDLTPALLHLWSSGRLSGRFHLPLQSGSSGVLSRMGRCYSPQEYRRAVDRVREAVPGATITTDLLVGFPGETDAEFEESLSLCRDIGFARIHVFPYSPRPGTLAAGMPGFLPPSVIEERCRRARALTAPGRLRGIGD